MNKKILVAENIHKQFGRKIILESINFEIEANQIIGICGANGSGKSVFLRILSGLILPTQGRVTIFGEILGKQTEFPHSTGILIDSPGLLLNENAWQNLYNLALVSGKINSQRIEEVITQVGLDPHDPKPVGVYSTGMRQRLGIAQALLEDPDFLILDEPTNGLDFDGQDMIHALLNDLRNRGKTILMTSHSRDEMLNVCDQTYLMADGKLHLYQPILLD
jgi:ABC-2 type transport system ATP-binding protein